MWKIDKKIPDKQKLWWLAFQPHTRNQTPGYAANVRGQGFGYRDDGDDEGQAEEQQQRTELLPGLDVGQGQTAVTTAVPRMHRLENIRQLQEIKTDNGGSQDRELK